MNLLELMVKIGVDDQASGKVESIGAGITSKLGAAGAAAASVLATAAAAAVAAVGVAAVKVTGEAVQAYSSFEQLSGGVAKLYGTASDQLMAYANNAYATAGMSANQYMEQATSFSAALVTSLGGDVSKAADMTDVAMRSMADNVNVFGSNMEDVQNAYQGFAKQNYTMLDNLKLGYGGTKEEMQRLIDDANALGEAMGESSDLSIDSFADIVTAIDRVQTSMGITGTTASEAAGTIEGSINMAKAAWDNFLVGLANPDADLSQLGQQFAESIANVAGNVLPRIGVVIGTIIGELPGMVAEIAPVLQDALASAVDEAGQAFYNLVPPEAQAAIDALGSAAEWLGERLEHIGSQAGEVLMPALQNLGDQFAQLMGNMEGASPMFEALSTVFAAIADTVGNILVAALTLLVDAVTLVVGIISSLLALVADFCASWEAASADVSAFCDTVGATLSALPGTVAGFLASVIASVVSWAASMLSNAISAASGFVSGVVGYLTALPGRAQALLAAVISAVTAWASNMVSGAVSAASRFASSLISGLSSLPGRVASIGSQIISGIVNGITGSAGRVVGAITGAVGNAISAAKSLLGIASPSKVFKRFGEYIDQGLELGIDAMAEGPAKAMARVVAGVEGASVTSTTYGAAAAGAGGYGAVYNIYLDGDLLEVDSKVTDAFQEFVAAVSRYSRG